MIYIKRKKILSSAGVKFFLPSGKKALISSIEYQHYKQIYFTSPIPSLFSFLSASHPSSNSLYQGLFCIHSFTSLQPCSAITPAILRSSSEKVLFTVGCLLRVPVQLIVIIFNLAVISIFDCLVRVCESSNKQIDYRIQLSITISILSIAASLLGPLLKVLNARHEFIPLGNLLKDIDVLFSQCRKKCINPITLQVLFFLKFLKSLSDFISWLWRILNFRAV